MPGSSKPRSGHRIWVSLILDLLASGATLQEIFDDHPGLIEADLQACLAYGAEMARERSVDVTLDLDFANPLVFEPRRHSGIAVLRMPPKASPSHGLALVETPLHARV